MKNFWMSLTAVCGLLVLAGVAAHFYNSSSSSDSPEPRNQARSDAIAAAVAEAAGRSDRGGWIAREGGNSGGTGGSRSGARDTTLGSEKGGGRGGGSGTVIGGGSRAGGRSGAGSGSGYSGSESAAIQAQVSVPAADGPFPNGRLAARDSHGQPGATDSQQRVVEKSGTPASSAPQDPNAPVLSVPFDKNTEPENGADQPAVDQEVQCGGLGEGCVFDTNSRYAIPDAGNLSGDAGSISFCLQPQWGGGDLSNAGLVDLETPNVWENRLKIFKNGDYFRFSIWPNSGAESGVSARINNWQAGQWHPVTVTFGPDPVTGQNIASMYIDGNMIGQQPYDGQLQIPQQPLYIGSGLPGGEPAAGGALKDFQAYNRVLPPDEAASFAAGCPQ
jgi:hypothetical protein